MFGGILIDEEGCPMYLNETQPQIAHPWRPRLEGKWRLGYTLLPTPQAKAERLAGCKPRFDRKTFFDRYRKEFISKRKLTQSKVDGLQRLLDFLEEDRDVKDLRWIAYMLATVKHECGDKWEPVYEDRTQQSCMAKYDMTGNPQKAANLGNTQANDGWTFRGRGYVQLTGRKNYHAMTTVVGRDLELAPDLALDASIAYKIMSSGMRNGTFTGVGLAKYISGATCDYRNARRIINGLDKWQTIKRYAEAFERILRASEAVIAKKQSQQKERHETFDKMMRGYEEPSRDPGAPVG